MTKTAIKTEDVLADMLTENTGSHFLDSGGAYGRNWQANKDLDVETLKARPLVRVELDGDELQDLTIELFHFLNECLEYDEEMDNRLSALAEEMPDNAAWSIVIQAFTDELEDATGLYGEGKPFTVNTYNGEDALSQIIQYTFFTLDDEEYVLLQIHGGCDARGGYTRPRVFRHYDGGCWTILDNARLSAATYYEESDDPKLFKVDPVLPRYWSSENAGYSFEDSENYNDKETDWVVKGGKVIYKPWGTEVHFMVP